MPVEMSQSEEVSRRRNDCIRYCLSVCCNQQAVPNHLARLLGSIQAYAQFGGFQPLPGEHDFIDAKNCSEAATDILHFGLQRPNKDFARTC